MADDQATPIADSLRRRHTDAIADVRAGKPAAFTVGAYTDGRTVRGELTIDRKWSNGWGLTAYARAWWNDVAVTPVAANPSKFGGEVGVEGRYDFPPKS